MCWRLLKRVSAVILVIACAALCMACSEDEKDPITVRIFSCNTTYNGTYVVNGGTAVSLPAGSDVGELYYGEFTLQDVNQVEVYVTTAIAADYLAIRIYRDNRKVKEVLGSSITTLSITYTYDEEDVSE